jgi:hypothetical protein
MTTARGWRMMRVILERKAGATEMGDKSPKNTAKASKQKGQKKAAASTKKK